MTNVSVTTPARLEADVRHLAEAVGERNLRVPGSLEQARDWLIARLGAAGCEVERQRYTLADDGHGLRGHAVDNVIGELVGSEPGAAAVVLGAHYDTVPGSPGANDNASAVAVLLALAAHFSRVTLRRTLRFCAFVNEEPPFHQGGDMGSHRYAARCRERGERIHAMLAMDGLGCFSDVPGSQLYPLAGLGLAYPRTGDFIGFVTRVRDAALLRRALAAFRRRVELPVQGAALPALVPGVDWSDHWSFWQHGYPAMMVTDTLPFRDPAYHTPMDTPQRLDYVRMALVADGLAAVVQRLAEAPAPGGGT